MQAVWKYDVRLEDNFELEMPIGAQILCVQSQLDRPQLWALVDPSAELESRAFRLAGTGHPIKETDLKYIGTFQALGGSFVGHLFEITKPTLHLSALNNP